MKPGEVYPFEIELYPISNAFHEGHRIRIVLSSSSFPKWYPNGNTGKETRTKTFRASLPRTRFTTMSEHPSKVVLPVIPQGGATN